MMNGVDDVEVFFTLMDADKSALMDADALMMPHVVCDGAECQNLYRRIDAFMSFKLPQYPVAAKSCLKDMKASIRR